MPLKGQQSKSTYANIAHRTSTILTNMFVIQLTTLVDRSRRFK